MWVSRFPRVRSERRGQPLSTDVSPARVGVLGTEDTLRKCEVNEHEAVFWETETACTSVLLSIPRDAHRPAPLPLHRKEEKK